MALFCLGERYSYQRLDNVSSQQLEPMLKAWLREQTSRRPVHWHQLSVVFCKIKESKPASTSMIMHEHRDKDIAGLAPEWRPRAQLLFVNYDDRLQQVSIYGSLSLEKYMRFVADFGFMTLGDLKTVPELDGQDEMIAEKREMKPYYTLDAAETGGEEFALATNWICTQILGLQQKTQDEEQNLDAELRALLRNDANNALGFSGATFIAACHARFRKAFVERELRLLRYRLEICYVNEQERAFFVDRWFPGLLAVQLNHFGQFVGHEEPEFFVRVIREAENPTSARKQYEVMQGCFDMLHPGEPQVSFYFTGQVQYLPEAFAMGLPVHRGNVCFSFREIPLYLENYLRHDLNERVRSLKLRHNTELAVPVWSNVERRRDKFRISDANKVAAKYSPGNTDIVMRALLERKLLTETSEDARFFVEEFAIPFIQQLDGNCGGFECEPLLPEPEYEQSAHSAVNLPAEHVMPTSHEALVEYAVRHWPPCMQRLVEGCVGSNHLQYDARLKMAAMLRRCGYTEPQGSHLWRLLFSRTNVYAQAESQGKDFLSSEQGLVITYDYQQNKQSSLGVSCKSLIAGDYCPVSNKLRTPDIEECQRGCLAEFNVVHSASLQYPVRSPQNYFQLSIKRV